MSDTYQSSNKLLLFFLGQTFLVLLLARVVNYYHKQIGLPDLLITFLALLNAIIVVIAIKRLNHYRYLSKELDLHKNHIQKIESTIKIIRGERHDFINHLQVISGLITTGQHDAAGKYLKDINGYCHFNSRMMAIKNLALGVLLQIKYKAAKNNGIKFELVTHSGLAELCIRADSVTTIFGNLLDNAIDHTKYLKGNKSIRFEVNELDDIYYFLISDTGPAINENVVDKIFNEGFSTKGNHRGHGLNLAKNEVESYGGQVYYDKENDCFTVILPKKLGE